MSAAAWTLFGLFILAGSAAVAQPWTDAGNRRWGILMLLAVVFGVAAVAA